MNYKSATHKDFQAEPLYQPNDDGKTAFVYQFAERYVSIATDITNFANQQRLRYNNAQEVTESNYAAKAFRPLPMKQNSASRLCISIKKFQHSENAPFLLSYFRKPHRRSIWQMASTTSSRATPQWLSRTIAEQMNSACPLLIIRHAYFDRVVKVPFPLIKAIMSSHTKWMNAKQLGNHTSQQSNWHPL